MKEELIRVEHGFVQSEGEDYQFDISIAKGECIGVYVDDHFTSGTAYLNLFKGESHLKHGRFFSSGYRVSGQELERWMSQESTLVDKHRFTSRELTLRDFLLALGKPSSREQWKRVSKRLQSSEAATMAQRMDLHLPVEQTLVTVSRLDYYRLCIFRAWLWNRELVVLDRLTEVLYQRDLEQLMQCVQLLLEHGTAVFLFDLDESFLHRFSARIDVVKNRKTCYRLYPEEYGEKLYQILGWNDHSGESRRMEQPSQSEVVLRLSDVVFPEMEPLNLKICSGEIAFLRDENYSTGLHLHNCFLGQQRWQSGTFYLNGTAYTHGELAKLIGTKIGIQMERPDRADGALFGNLTALDNLSTFLLPKAGKCIATRRMMESILNEAFQWFDREALQRPLQTWPLQQRLRLSYYKWYLLNPKLLICFFPFAGQESAHHEMIIDLLVTCAERGMAVWVVSSGIDAIFEKTENEAFLKRLRYLN